MNRASRRAAPPVFPRASAPLPPRSVGSVSAPLGCRVRTVDLHPALLRIELLRISASQHFKRSVGMGLVIDLRLSVLMGEPIGSDEVCYEDIADFVAILVILNRITDLTRPKNPLLTLECTV